MERVIEEEMVVEGSGEGGDGGGGGDDRGWSPNRWEKRGADIPHRRTRKFILTNLAPTRAASPATCCTRWKWRSTVEN